MAIMNKDYTPVDLINDGLLVHIKEHVENAIVKKYLTEVEKDLRKLIKVETERLVLGSVEQIADALDYGRKFGIEFKWSNDE